MNSDEPNIESVVLPHLSDAIALARWIARSHADADDIVQEAFLKALRAIGGYAGGSGRAWFLKIVRNTALSWLAKNRPSHTLSIEALEPSDQMRVENGGPLPVQLTPETALLAKVNTSLLEAAIAQLPMEFREAIVLRDIHGLDYREIAQVTAAPVGTVMSRLSRARERLRETLKVLHVQNQQSDGVVRQLRSRVQ
jgi:RNA polymerase sigma-70 factor (ECF subfamily)